MSRAFYYFCISLVRVFFFVFTRWRIIGKENIPKTGGLLVVSNHLSFSDTPLISMLLGRKSKFAARENFFKRIVVKQAFNAWGGFPIGSGLNALTAVRLAQQFTDEGLAVVIFPEGHRSTNFKLGQGLPGAALFASQTKAPILPIGITGTEKMKGFTWYFKRPTITVIFGKPFHLSNESGKIDREKATRIIMEHIAELLPPEYQGLYAQPEAKK